MPLARRYCGLSGQALVVMLLFALSAWSLVLSTSSVWAGLVPRAPDTSTDASTDASASARPSVTIASGTLVGRRDASIDSFVGIPYAKPPTGLLRLARPQPFSGSLGTTTLAPTATACPQPPGNQTSNVTLPSMPPKLAQALVTLGTPPTVQGEDCLTVTVQRPAGTASDAKLPVLFFIYGGGFQTGSTQVYNGSRLLQQGMDIKLPFVYVAVNYRLGGFGWLAGQELQKAGSTNLGLRDQRLGLNWVADNIAAFGGDPAKVTIMGESAGAISVLDHLIVNGGNITYKGQPLFRGAIMSSGSILRADNVTSSKPQTEYDRVVKDTGCAGQADTLACLRALPYDKYAAANPTTNAVTAYSGLNSALLPRPDSTDNFFPVSPEIAIGSGKFAKVPVIVGDQEDEGTLFSLAQTNLSTTDDLVSYLQTYWPLTPRATISGAVATYPDDPAAGSPFDTGDMYNTYPEHKRLAASLGDIQFTLQRRLVCAALSPAVPTWSYLSTYLYGTQALGTFHETDVLGYFLGTPAHALVAQPMSYLIGFVSKLDPNAAPSLPAWPKWDGSGSGGVGMAQITNFTTSGTSVLIRDGFRMDSYNYLAQHGQAFRV